MAETPGTDTDRTLLTRREIRKLFRVNERTINRWMDRGLLMQVGEIPGEEGSPTKPVFAVRDDSLVQKLQARLENVEQLELDADRLPPESREELVRRASRSEATEQVAPEPGPATTSEEVPPPEQAAVEASAYPELAEALWDEEALGALHHAAETLHDTATTLSAEAGRLSSREQAVASRELEAAGIDLEEEEDHGPQVIDEEDERHDEPEAGAAGTLPASGGDDLATERLLLQAELAEVKSLQQANLERMGERIAYLENLVEELGLTTAEEMNIQALLEEIRGNVVVNESRRDIMAASMTMISDSVQELRTELAAANRTTLATAKSVQQLGKKLKVQAVGPSEGASEDHGPKVTPVLVLGAGILVLTWTLALYLKTGSSLVALMGVVLANLAACATIFLGRKER